MKRRRGRREGGKERGRNCRGRFPDRVPSFAEAEPRGFHAWLFTKIRPGPHCRARCGVAQHFPSWLFAGRKCEIIDNYLFVLVFEILNGFHNSPKTGSPGSAGCAESAIATPGTRVQSPLELGTDNPRALPTSGSRHVEGERRE